jgi:hypothetical protein
MIAVEALLDRSLEHDKLPRSDGWRWRWSEEVLQELATQPLRASVYRDHKRNRALIVVVNFARLPVQGKVTLKLDGLGLSSARRTLTVWDVDYWRLNQWDKRQPPSQLSSRNNQIDLAVNGHDFRLIELTWS